MHTITSFFYKHQNNNKESKTELLKSKGLKNTPRSNRISTQKERERKRTLVCGLSKDYEKRR